MVRRGRRPRNATTSTATAKAAGAEAEAIVATSSSTTIGTSLGAAPATTVPSLTSRNALKKNLIALDGGNVLLTNGISETEMKRTSSGALPKSQSAVAAGRAGALARGGATSVAKSSAQSQLYENHQHFASPKRKDCKVDKQLQVESYDGDRHIDDNVNDNDVDEDLIAITEDEIYPNKYENSAPNIDNIMKNIGKIKSKKTRGRGICNNEASKAIVGIPLATRAQTRTIDLFFQNKNDSSNPILKNDKGTKILLTNCNDSNSSSSEYTANNIYENSCKENGVEQMTNGLSPAISIADSDDDNSNGTEDSESTCAANALLDFAGVNINAYRDVSQSSSSFRSSTSDVENIFLQEPVLTLNVDKSPIQAACCVKINKSLDSEPIFSSPPSSLATAALNGRFSQIVTLNSSPMKQKINDMDFPNALHSFDYKMANNPRNGFIPVNFIATNVNNNNLNLTNGILEETNNTDGLGLGAGGESSVGLGVGVTTPLIKSNSSVRSDRKPTTPHRIVVCGSPIKTKSSHTSASITTSPSKRNASNKDDMINHQSPRKSQRHMLSMNQGNANATIASLSITKSSPSSKTASNQATKASTATASVTTKTRRRLNQKGLDLYLAGNESSSSSSASHLSKPISIAANQKTLNKTSSKLSTRQRSQMNGFKPINVLHNNHITISDDEDDNDNNDDDDADDDDGVAAHPEDLEDDDDDDHTENVEGEEEHLNLNPNNLYNDVHQDEFKVKNKKKSEEGNENLNKIKQKSFLQKLTANTTAQQKSQSKYKNSMGGGGGVVAKAGTGVGNLKGSLPPGPQKTSTLKSKNISNHLTNHSNQPLALTNGNREMTEFFPLRRRSERKTKTAVKEEMMRNLEQAILEEREEGLKIGYFEGKGRGIISDRHFKRGEFVVEYIGDFISINEASAREKRYALDENAGCYMYYFKHKNQQYCIDATEDTGKLGRLVNHSRNGNLVTKVVVVKQRPHLVLIAKEDIQPGEELTYDYGDRSKLSLLHHPWLAF